MSHELCRAFAEVSLPLAPRLEEMLDEHFSHRTERRGCGFTQATRFLSTWINQPRHVDSTSDLRVFADLASRSANSVAMAASAAGWSAGWRRLDLAPEAVIERLTVSPRVEQLRQLEARIMAAAQPLQHDESRLIHAMVHDVMQADDADRDGDRDGERLPAMACKPDIGSCTAAEEFFLEIAHGRVRRGGHVNIVTGGDGAPLLVEKMALGESHSALSIGVVVINGVALPPGSLFALKWQSRRTERAIECGQVLRSDDIAQARFLRLTTLAVAPDIRERAFSCQLQAQVRDHMFSPRTTTLEHMREFVAGVLRA